MAEDTRWQSDDHNQVAQWLIEHPGACLLSRYHDAAECWKLLDALLEITRNRKRKTVTTPRHVLILTAILVFLALLFLSVGAYMVSTAVGFMVSGLVLLFLAILVVVSYGPMT